MVLAYINQVSCFLLRKYLQKSKSFLFQSYCVCCISVSLQYEYVSPLLLYKYILPFCSILICQYFIFSSLSVNLLDRNLLPFNYTFFLQYYLLLTISAYFCIVHLLYQILSFNVFIFVYTSACHCARLLCSRYVQCTYLYFCYCQRSQEKVESRSYFAIQKSKRADSQAQRIGENSFNSKVLRPQYFCFLYEMDPELTRAKHIIKVQSKTPFILSIY